jgi:hypothetical protein
MSSDAYVLSLDCLDPLLLLQGRRETWRINSSTTGRLCLASIVRTPDGRTAALAADRTATMRTPWSHDGPHHPLHRKPQLKPVLVVVVVVAVAATLPPDHVSAVAQAVGAAVASTVALRGTRETGLTLG